MLRLATADEPVELVFNQEITQSTSGGDPSVGVGINSTTTVSGFSPSPQVASGDAANCMGMLSDVPRLGINDYQMLETGGGAGTTTWRGTEAQMTMTARYMG